MVAATTISRTPKCFVNKIALLLLALATFLVLYTVDAQAAEPSPPPEQPPNDPQLTTISIQYKPKSGSSGVSNCDVKSQKLTFSELKKKEQSDSMLQCQSRVNTQNGIGCLYGNNQPMECKAVEDFCKQELKGQYSVAFGQCLQY